MTKSKKTDVAEPRKKMGRHGYLAVLLAVMVTVIVLGLVFAGVFVRSNAKFPMTAAIVDQLRQDYPDASFVSNMTNMLQNHGFNVTYYGGPIDVEFYKKLATYNYGIIILRAHSALRNDNSTIDLFTSEKYAPGIYDQELSDGDLAIGEFYDRPGEQYFVVTSKFISDYMEGGFSQSIVIAMGCQSLKPGCEQMAQAFIDKGASAYIGWSDIVFPEDTDNQTMRLMSMLLDEDFTLSYAVVGTTPYTYNGVYPNSTQTVRVTTEMRFYPQVEQDLTVGALTKESQPSPGARAFTVLGLLPVTIAEGLPGWRKKSLRYPPKHLQELQRVHCYFNHW